MVSINSAGNNPFIEQTNATGIKAANHTVQPYSAQETTTQSADVNVTKTYKQGSSPSTVNFQEPKHERAYNPLISLFAAFLAVGGSLASGTANDDLFEAVKKDLKETAQFLSQHGLAYDMSIVGQATPKKTEDLLTREDKYPHAKKAE